MFGQGRFSVRVMAAMTVLTIAAAYIATNQALAQVALLAGNHSPAIASLAAPSAARSDNVLTMRIILRPSNSAQLDNLLAQQQDSFVTAVPSMVQARRV
jgi:hypothetical protein